VGFVEDPCAVCSAKDDGDEEEDDSASENMLVCSVFCAARDGTEGCSVCSERWVEMVFLSMFVAERYISHLSGFKCLPSKPVP
jgi:hypothetical protein